MHSHGDRFIPAAGRDWLLPFYDPLNRLIGAERVKRRLVEVAGIAPGERVLDLGTGTGDVAIAVKRAVPGALVSAVDPDPKALARARAKAARAGVEVEFEQGFGGALPYADSSFEHVVSSLVLHHLDTDGKRAALAEVRRVLVPGGSLHVLDFGPPSGGVQRMLTHLLHRDADVGDNLAGLVPALMRDAGLADAREVERLRTLVGGLALYEARRQPREG